MLTLTAIGHIGKDATVREVNDKKVINFSVAHTEKFKNGQGVTTEKTQWIECSHWDAVNLAPYLKQGTMVYIMGAPEPRAWKDKDDEARASISVRVLKIDLLSSGKKEDAAPVKTEEKKQDKKSQTPKEKAMAASAAATNDGSDDLPF